MFASVLGYIDVTSVIFTNGATVTGMRYLVKYNGVLNTNTGNVNYIPGNAAGSTSNGGQYI